MIFVKIKQFEINKKRDTELAKLRKLLEDVHLESEETAHLLRKKHQEVVVDFQDQIDQLSKARARSANQSKLQSLKKIYFYISKHNRLVKSLVENIIFSIFVLRYINTYLLLRIVAPTKAISLMHSSNDTKNSYITIYSITFGISSFYFQYGIILNTNMTRYYTNYTRRF